MSNPVAFYLENGAFDSGVLYIVIPFILTNFFHNAFQT